MRAVAICLMFLFAQINAVHAQTENDVKGDILAALSTPLPITVIGPLIASDVEVAREGDGFRATLIQPMLMGIVPLTTMSFKMTPAGDKLYRVTDFELPRTLNVFNSVTIGLGSTEFDGVWSTETRSYQTLDFELSDINLSPMGAGASMVSIGSLALEVAKEGEAGATESRFALSATDVTSNGFPPNNVQVSSLVAELQANGEEPVDLYAVLSRFAVLTAINQDSGAALRFAESLRAKRYDNVLLNIKLDGVELSGAQPGSNKNLSITELTGAATITDMSPDEWGTVSVKFDGREINDNGILDVREVTLETGTLSLEGAAIPIGATLNAITKMQAASRGETVSLRVSELLDGLLNMGALKLNSSATGITYLPQNDRDPIVRIGNYSFETGSEGFRDDNGRLFLETSVEGMDIDLREFSNAMEEKAYRVLNPTLLRYDLSISELNEPLLRKLMADIVINNDDDYAALAAPAVTYFLALKPMVETKDGRYVSAEVDATLSGLVRFYPAWLTEALPYEGGGKIKIAGLDNLTALFDEYLATPSQNGGARRSDRAGQIVIRSLISTFQALAISEDDAQTWNIEYPEAGRGLMVVNDTELRFPNVANYMMIPMMGILR